ncbi:glycine dehydrogenase (decarboxylating), mitochondrial-like [Halichondria panicea]|uniref:glycine dehydrogenase (decarboxylating), mitochondrial-like n=1 Tax=Halichondria panicea TaxID=6063 RepID=UPI00312BA289
MAFARQLLLPRHKRGLQFTWTRHIFSSSVVRHERLNEVLPPLECFTKRHIGPSEQETGEMLRACGVESMDELISKTVPENIRLNRLLKLDTPLSELELHKRVEKLASKNTLHRSYIGLGYHDTIMPAVIKRNILENPGWITQYTPYQPEMSQGRLESLMNYQTLISDLTGLDIANASLLDEASAAAEAMALCHRQCKWTETPLFLVDSRCHPQSIAVVRTRASHLGVEVVESDFRDFDFSSGQVCGVLLQYPNTDGQINDYSQVIEKAHGQEKKAMVAMATDLLALTLLKPPGDLGADIAFGNAQRFGVPMGYGGPHAGFFAVKKEYTKNLPGRIVGETWDSHDNPSYRLCLQTREQHIRRDKATSNICTAQALLANISAMYAVYHGPEGLREIATRVHRSTLVLAEALRRQGHIVHQGPFFDTVKVTCNFDVADRLKVLRRGMEKKINLRIYEDESLGVALDETVTPSDMADLMWMFGTSRGVQDSIINSPPAEDTEGVIPGTPFERTSQFLQHSVFNSYHSETALLRYMKRLENLDLSLVHSMIPLGSCTLKLNATSQLIPVSMAEFNSLHPFIPEEQAVGYQELLEELERDLCEITGYDKFSFQANSGAQGEFSGLCAIMAYHSDQGEQHRNICLIPASAHGTNAASAQMAGLQVVTLPTNKDGSVSVSVFKEEIVKHQKNLAAVMITYPSTSGVFEESIVEICSTVHDYGGQVYVDGANMNAQVGLCRPGDYGGDVSHLNLHKTFCIPHGGGGPGMGPIGVKAHLAPYLPTHPITRLPGAQLDKSFGTVSAAAWGSASILPISWAYIRLMGPRGLTKATEMAILNANYMVAKLKDHYKILFTGSQGFNAHEFIIDTREYKAKTGVEAVDIAKRLQDYGCHAPTISWPVINTLMCEPTESENKEMLDNYCDALISIRGEIKDIEDGKYDQKNNLLKNAPHTMKVVTGSTWDLPYSREEAAFPVKWLTPVNKLWPGSGRVNEVYGDRNVVATRYGKPDKS